MTLPEKIQQQRNELVQQVIKDINLVNHSFGIAVILVNDLEIF